MQQRAFRFIRTNLNYILIAGICGLILFFYIRFDQVALSTDDDVQLNLIASGAFGPHSQYLIYMNVLYGYFLKLLYLALPSVNWYLFCSLITNLLAIIFLCCLFCRKLPALLCVTAAPLCMLFFSKDFLLSTQFTTNVWLLAAVGYIWLFYALKHKKKAALIPATFFCVLSAMWRSSAFLMTLPFFCVIPAVHLVYNRHTLLKNKPEIRKILPYILVPLAAAVLCIGLDTLTYLKDPDWNYFNRRVKALVELQDRGFMDYVNHKELYDEAGFPQSQINLITGWLDNDPEVFSLENLQRMASVKRSYDRISLRVDPGILGKTVRHVLHTLLQGERRTPWLFICSIVFYLLLKDRRRLWISVLMCCAVAGVYYILLCYGRTGWHVEIGIWLLAFLLPLGDFLTDERAAVSASPYKKADRHLMTAAAVLSVLSVLVCGAYLAAHPSEARLVNAPSTVRKTNQSHEVLEYICAHKDCFYVVTSPMSVGYWGAASVYDLNYSNASDFENICWLGGWFAGSPIGNYHAHEAGISNPVRALLERPETYLVAPDNVAEWMIYYFQENYRHDVLYEKVDTVADAGIWRFTVPQ